MKPVIFIPGFPASELVEASTGRVLFPPSLGDLAHADRKKRLIDRLTGATGQPGEIIAGEPIRAILHIAKQSESLYDILRTYGYAMSNGGNFTGFGWDWRQGIDDEAMQLRLLAEIESLVTSAGAAVVAIVHSTGGLVLRSLLEKHPEVAPSIEQVLAFGVPWAGTLKSLFFVSKGESIGIPGAKLTAGQVASILSRAQAAYDIFPPDPLQTDLHDRSGTAIDFFLNAHGMPDSPMTDESWIPSGASGAPMRERARSANQRLGLRSSTLDAPANTIPVTCVAGWGASTETLATVDSEGGLHFSFSDQGDGTVPVASASWLRGANVRTFFVPVGIYPTAGLPMLHSRIWDSPPLLEIFDQVLHDKPRDVFFAAAADGDSANSPSVPAVEIRLTAADGEGLVPQGCRATFLELNQSAPVIFGSDPRRSVTLRRADLRPNFGSRYFRFVIQFSWTTISREERREVPVVIRLS
ncbi:MAG: hypothetical protein ABI718_08135 [Acidobacteriota bacterium]